MSNLTLTVGINNHFRFNGTLMVSVKVKILTRSLGNLPNRSGCTAK